MELGASEPARVAGPPVSGAQNPGKKTLKIYGFRGQFKGGTLWPTEDPLFKGMEVARTRESSSDVHETIPIVPARGRKLLRMRASWPSLLELLGLFEASFV